MPEMAWTLFYVQWTEKASGIKWILNRDLKKIREPSVQILGEENSKQRKHKYKGWILNQGKAEGQLIRFIVYIYSEC